MTTHHRSAVEHDQSANTDDRSLHKAKISLPDEIIEEILSRLPVKSVLRFKSVSKPWRSLISDPSFTKLHSAVGPRTAALFFSVFDSSTGTRYFFSGARDDGSVANLMKLDSNPYPFCRAEHLNGLVCFTSPIGLSYAYVFNPTTHKVFKLPEPPVPLRNYTNLKTDSGYLFGFDESSNEHKVLYIDVGLIKPTTMVLLIFSMSTYSWRMINVDLPIRIDVDRWWFGTGFGVCVNSVIHLMLRNPLEILAFDLATDKFSFVRIPPYAMAQNMHATIYPCARFTKINGLLGVCIYRTEEINKVDIWILQDYQNRVWVKETITFPPESGISNGAGVPYPFDFSINMGEIIFAQGLLSEDLVSVPIRLDVLNQFNSLLVIDF